MMETFGDLERGRYSLARMMHALQTEDKAQFHTAAALTPDDPNVNDNEVIVSQQGSGGTFLVSVMDHESGNYYSRKFTYPGQLVNYLKKVAGETRHWSRDN